MEVLSGPTIMLTCSIVRLCSIHINTGIRTALLCLEAKLSSCLLDHILNLKFCAYTTSKALACKCQALDATSTIHIATGLLKELTSSSRSTISTTILPLGTIFRRSHPLMLTHAFVQELEDRFSRYGPVREARIVRNPRTGESRGFGFVMMDGEEDVDQVWPSTDCRQHDPWMVLGSVALAMWQATRTMLL